MCDLPRTPSSRHNFQRTACRFVLQRVPITYVLMGSELGGRPADPSCYDQDGKVEYEACRRRPEYRRGIDRLANAVEQARTVALLCSERKPEMCHRFKLVSVDLEEQAIMVEHIDEGGELVTQLDVKRRLLNGECRCSMISTRRRC